MRAPHEEGVDVLVCDLQLKHESGLDLFAARAHRQEDSADGGHQRRGHARRDAFALAAAGALLFLEKPFGTDALVEAIHTVNDRAPPLEPFVAAQLGQRSLPEVQDTVRRALLSQALAVTRGNQQRAARMLGLTRQRVNQLVKGK